MFAFCSFQRARSCHTLSQIMSCDSRQMRTPWQWLAVFLVIPQKELFAWLRTRQNQSNKNIQAASEGVCMIMFERHFLHTKQHHDDIHAQQTRDPTITAAAGSYGSYSNLSITFRPRQKVCQNSLLQHPSTLSSLYESTGNANTSSRSDRQWSSLLSTRLLSNYGPCQQWLWRGQWRRRRWTAAIGINDVSTFTHTILIMLAQ